MNEKRTSDDSEMSVRLDLYHIYRIYLTESFAASQKKRPYGYDLRQSAKSASSAFYLCPTCTLPLMAQPDLVWLTFRESARSTLGIPSVRAAFLECMCDPMKSQRTPRWIAPI